MQQSGLSMTERGRGQKNRRLELHQEARANRDRLQHQRRSHKPVGRNPPRGRDGALKSLRRTETQRQALHEGCQSLRVPAVQQNRGHIACRSWSSPQNATKRSSPQEGRCRRLARSQAGHEPPHRLSRGSSVPQHRIVSVDSMTEQPSRFGREPCCFPQPVAEGGLCEVWASESAGERFGGHGGA